VGGMPSRPGAPGGAAMGNRFAQPMGDFRGILQPSIESLSPRGQGTPADQPLDIHGPPKDRIGPYGDAGMQPTSARLPPPAQGAGPYSKTLDMMRNLSTPMGGTGPGQGDIRSVAQLSPTGGEPSTPNEASMDREGPGAGGATAQRRHQDRRRWGHKVAASVIATCMIEGSF
jgi:hypothetical protein